MTDDFLERYQFLAQELTAILLADLSESEKMEHCFKCCIEHWNNLREKIKREGFDNDTEEIHFFKNVKPRFTGETEYYAQRYHAILFSAGKPEKDMMEYWDKQLIRIAKFYGANEFFFRYFRAGRTDEDATYFLMRNSDGSNMQFAKVYDLDEDTATSHDWLISMDIAFTKYREFIKEEQRKLV